MFRSSLRHLLTAPPSVIEEVYGVNVGAGFQVVGEAGSGEETVSVVQSVKPDLLLLDLSMPRMSGLDALAELVTHRENMRTVLLAGVIDKAHLLTAVQLGVRGVVVKDSTTELLFEAIVSVMGGRFWLGQTLVSDLIELVRTLSQTSNSAGTKQDLGLTRREREVLQWAAAGKTNAEIGAILDMSPRTVEKHFEHVFEKLGVETRVAAVMRLLAGSLQRSNA